MNITLFTGRLVKDPSLSTTTNGTKVCTCSIAVNDGFGDNKKTYFPQIVFWKGQAEYLSKYGKKGSMLEVKCRYTERKYENKNSGAETKVCEFVAEEVRIISTSSVESSLNSSNQQTTSYEPSFPSYDESAIPSYEVDLGDLYDRY